MKPSICANTVRPEFMPQTSQKEVTVSLRGKFALQIAEIENRLVGHMWPTFADIKHEIYRTPVFTHMLSVPNLCKTAPALDQWPITGGELRFLG